MNSRVLAVVPILLIAALCVGIQLNVDDFGTGHSTLSYLKDYPVRTLKIDRSFVKNMETGGAEATRLIAFIVDMAASLDVAVTAEGIETDEQRAILTRIGCGYGQGYYFSKPVGLADLEGVWATSGEAVLA